LIAVLSHNPALLLSLTAIIGLLGGSFLNVVILRLPRRLFFEWRSECQALLEDEGASVGNLPEQSEPPGIVFPRSRCRSCGVAIRAFDNIPILSFILLRGRCRQCGTAIGWRYPIVEALTAALSVVVVWHFGWGWMGLAGVVLTWGLIALAGIDLDHQILPDGITLGLLWVGLVISLADWSPLDPAGAIIGAVSGYLVLWLVYHCFRLLTGKHGMGHGDFKLLAAAGAWLGWQMLPLVILGASLLGAVIGGAWLALQRQGRQTPIPFGPFLALATWVALIWGEPIMRAYLG